MGERDEEKSPETHPIFQDKLTIRFQKHLKDTLAKANQAIVESGISKEAQDSPQERPEEDNIESSRGSDELSPSANDHP